MIVLYKANHSACTSSILCLSFYENVLKQCGPHDNDMEHFEASLTAELLLSRLTFEHIRNFSQRVQWSYHFFSSEELSTYDSVVFSMKNYCVH